MGSGSSKEKAALHTQLEELGQKYKAAVQAISLRENQISAKEKELEAARREAAETQGLKARVLELEKQIVSLREERQREVNRLQDELTRELSGQLRVAESLTQERNLARKEVGQLREKLSSIEGAHADAIKKLEDAGKASTAESELKRGELEKELQSRGEDLSNTKTELEGLKQEKQRLQESEKTAGEELTAAKSKVADVERERDGFSGQLEEVRRKLQESEKAREDLTQGSRTVNDELAAAKSAADGEVRKQEELAEHLASTQQQVAYLETSRDTLQKQHNEGISKRSALHEAFSATKIELSEWVQGYKKLQGEKKASDEKVKTLEEQTKASSGSSEVLEKTKKELSESRDKHSKLQGEYEGSLKELEATKQSSADAQTAQKELMAQLEASKRQSAEAEEASRKQSEQHQAEIDELRKALREAKESQPKSADIEDVTPFETPLATFGNGHTANGLENGYFFGGMKANGEATAV